MELRQLRYFVQVAEDLHFGRAADRLGISQPPLSQQIRHLEDELGVRLFERTSRRVALSAAGALFLDAARRTLAQADEAMTIARRAARGELGALRIGFVASAPLVPRIARAIYEFGEHFPGVELALSEMPGPAQVAAIAGGSIDLGFFRSGERPLLPPGLSAARVHDERLFVGVRPDHRFAARERLCFKELADEPLIIYARDRAGGFTEELMAMFDAAGVQPRISQSVREIATLLGLAAAGVGITILSQSLSALRSNGLVYVPLVDPSAHTTIWLISDPDRASLPARNFLTILEGLVAESQVRQHDGF